MRKISFWAKNHKWAARVIIVASYILLNILGITTGILLHEMKITFLTPVLSSLIGIFLTSVLSYPSKPKKGKRLSPKSFISNKKASILSWLLQHLECSSAWETGLKNSFFLVP
jgi:hypothetical protein